MALTKKALQEVIDKSEENLRGEIKAVRDGLEQKIDTTAERLDNRIEAAEKTLRGELTAALEEQTTFYLGQQPRHVAQGSL